MPTGSDRAILGRGEKTIPHLKRQAVIRQHQATAIALTQELHIRDREPFDIGKATEIKQVFETTEGVILRRRRAPQRQVQLDGASRHVFGSHIDLAPDTYASHQRPDGDLRHIGHVRQSGFNGGGIGRSRGANLVFPTRRIIRLQLAVAYNPAAAEHIDIVDRRMYVERVRQ